jgi:hypothetical protein
MRPPLSDPSHAAACRARGNSLAPLGRVLSELASRPYANQVYGHWGHDWFFIGTAPCDEEMDSPLDREILCLVPVGKRFRVGYGETPTSEWGWRLAEDEVTVEQSGCWQECSENEAVTLADRIITRDLNAWVKKGKDT